MCIKIWLQLNIYHLDYLKILILKTIPRQKYSSKTFEGHLISEGYNYLSRISSRFDIELMFSNECKKGQYTPIDIIF